MMDFAMAMLIMLATMGAGVILWDEFKSKQYKDGEMKDTLIRQFKENEERMAKLLDEAERRYNVLAAEFSRYKEECGAETKDDNK